MIEIWRRGLWEERKTGVAGSNLFSSMYLPRPVIHPARLLKIYV